jgi:hypothetical protein
VIGPEIHRCTIGAGAPAYVRTTPGRSYDGCLGSEETLKESATVDGLDLGPVPYWVVYLIREHSVVHDGQFGGYVGT